MKNKRWRFSRGDNGDGCQLCETELAITRIAGVRLGPECLRRVEEIKRGDLSRAPKPEKARRPVQLGPKRRPGRQRKERAA